MSTSALCISPSTALREAKRKLKEYEEKVRSLEEQRERLMEIANLLKIQLDSARYPSAASAAAAAAAAAAAPPVHTNDTLAQPYVFARSFFGRFVFCMWACTCIVFLVSLSWFSSHPSALLSCRIDRVLENAASSEYVSSLCCSSFTHNTSSSSQSLK